MWWWSAATYVSVLEVTSMDELEWSLPDVLALRLRKARLMGVRCNPPRFSCDGRTVRPHRGASRARGRERVYREDGTASFLSSMWSCR